MSDTALVPVGDQQLAVMQAMKESIEESLAASRAASTLQAYAADWEHFAGWCTAYGMPALPAHPATVAGYLTALKDDGKSASTINRRVAAIRHYHREAGHESPTNTAFIERVMAGIRRQIGTAAHGKAPVVTDDIRVMVDTLPPTLRGVRDRALLLVGFAGAFRRSELIALRVEDIEETGEGLRVTIRRSKTDQEGEGRVIAIPAGKTDYCPVKAYRAWLAAAGITTGPAFRAVNRHSQVRGALSGIDVARAVKNAAAAAGLDPARFSGHSLRAGLATSAAIAGASERVIMQQTGHKSERMVRRYIREGNLFRENAVNHLGL